MRSIFRVHEDDGATAARAPKFGPHSRPDWVVSRNAEPLAIENDEGVLKAA